MFSVQHMLCIDLTADSKVNNNAFNLCVFQATDQYVTIFATTKTTEKEKRLATSFSCI